MSIRLIFAVALGFLGGASTGAEDYSDLLEEAIETIDWQFEQEWAFTETSLNDGLLFVARFDPGLKEDERWSLISVDGREPTDRQQREFRHDKEEQRGDSNDGFDQLSASVEPDTLELIEETARTGCFRLFRIWTRRNWSMASMQPSRS